MQTVLYTLGPPDGLRLERMAFRPLLFNGGNEPSDRHRHQGCYEFCVHSKSEAT